MPTLTITRGLPASGKTTYARGYVAEDQDRRARVNRDDLRVAMYGKPVLDASGERAVTTAQQSAVRALLQSGRDVIVDDTNLRARYARAWADLAASEGASFEVVDFTTPVDECVARDAARDRHVGESVIRRLHDRYIAGGRGFAPVTPTATQGEEFSRYVPNELLQPAWLVDVDGTLTTGPGNRSPYDWDRVGEDAPNMPVIRMVRALAKNGVHLIAVSGRDGICRDATWEWLKEHRVPVTALYMRRPGDTRDDTIVKSEILDEHIAPRYWVLGVIDDRDKVVAMWRARGLTCAQVAPGKF
jgi:predicted kinase